MRDRRPALLGLAVFGLMFIYWWGVEMTFLLLWTFPLFAGVAAYAVASVVLVAWRRTHKASR